MLLKNGHLIDPATRTAAPRDIRITNGIITELAQNLVPQNEEEILDLSGLILMTRFNMCFLLLLLLWKN